MISILAYFLAGIIFALYVTPILKGIATVICDYLEVLSTLCEAKISRIAKKTNDEINGNSKKIKMGFIVNEEEEETDEDD